MNLDQLPKDYTNFDFDLICATLKKYSHNDLMDGAIVQKHPLAQLAILVKLENKLEPFESLSLRQRVDIAITFWDSIISKGAITESGPNPCRIATSVLEILMAHEWYLSSGHEKATIEDIRFGCDAVERIQQLDKTKQDSFIKQLSRRAYAPPRNFF